MIVEVADRWNDHWTIIQIEFFLSRSLVDRLLARLELNSPAEWLMRLQIVVEIKECEKYGKSLMKIV